ncbi:MAG: hypothetical protein KGQ61_02090 [Planctomycetes bacterium]|nr:hypothetical protein [Planctomycetota bacterium]
MRLTLRTLLAWKDGVLPEAELRALGEKVTASPVAGPLLERIDEVVARPQVGAARTDARGLGGDPVSVARYLDNTLPDEQLEPFERICLESDIHLAEVASCHRILAGLGQEPTGLPPLDATTRARLLAALAQASAARPVDGGTVVVESAERGATATTRTPSRRGRVPWLAWGTAALALATVAALVGVLVTALSARPGAGAGRRPGQPDALAAAGGRAVAEPAAPVAAAPPLGTAVPTASEPSPPAVPETAPVPAEGAAPAVTVSVPVAPAAGAAAGGERPPGSDQPDAAAARASVTGTGALVWRPAGRGGEWTAVLPGAEIGAAADLVVPPGAEPAVTALGITVRPRPGSRCVITVDAAASPRLEVLFGGCVVTADRPDATLRIAVAGLEAMVGGSLAAGVEVEASRLLPDGADPATTVATVSGRITALGDGIRLSVAASGEGIQLEAGRTLAWDGADPGAATVVAVARPIVREDAARERLERSAAAALAARLAAGADLDAALTALAGSRRVEQRALAAHTGALLGRYDDLVDLLVADGPPRGLRDGQWEEVFAAAVPLALARGANAAAALRQAVGSRAPPGRGDLLWGLVTGPDPGADRATALAALVDLLDDETLVVRRAAYVQLCRLSVPTAADRARYQPDSPPERRRDGVAWWRRQVDRRPAGAAPRE